MARAATAPELVKFRSDGQASRLYLAIHKPATVLAARVNQTFETTDQVSQVAFDTVTAGAYTGVIEGMTLYVGSSAGAWDIGLARVLAATETQLTLNATSDIAWADNLYLTVVDEIGLWARNLARVGTDLLMDGSIPYGDENLNFEAVPVLGPLAAVYWLDGATVTHAPTAAPSWVLGANLTGYSWTAPGSSNLANGNSATPTITYNAARGANAYRTACALTSSNGKTGTGYRRVFVFDRSNNMPITQFVVSSLEGQHGAGWRMSVELFDQAAIADVRDRALVVLFGEDFYGGAKSSIGPVSGYENVLFAGWVDGESIQISPVGSSVRFSVEGSAGWMDRIHTESLSLINVDATPTQWTEIQDLTVDKAYYHLIRWRSTASTCIDCYRTEDTHELPLESQLSGSLFGQISAIGGHIFAAASSDPLGRLFLEIDTQMLPVVSRAGIPTVQALTKDDWSEMTIERRPGPRTAMFELASSVVGQTVFRSRAPGLIPSRSGSFARYDEILAADQDEINRLCGLAFAKDNNPYPNVDVELVANNRLIGTCPRQRLSLSLASGDTVRGIAWTNKLFLPRLVVLRVDVESGAITASLTLEAETDGPPGAIYIQPQSPLDNIPDQPIDDLPPLSPIESGIGVPPPRVGRPPDDPVATDPTCVDANAPANGGYEVFPQSDVIQADPEASPDYGQVIIPYPCYIRAGTAVNRTRLMIQRAIRYRVEDTWFVLSQYNNSLITASAVDAAGNDLIIGSNETYVGYPDLMWSTFSPAGGMNVSGFKIKLDHYTSTAYVPDSGENVYWEHLSVSTDCAYPGHPIVVSGDHSDTDHGWLQFCHLNIDLGFTPDIDVSVYFRVNPQGVGYNHIDVSTDGETWEQGGGQGLGAQWWTIGRSVNGYRYIRLTHYADSPYAIAYAYLTGYRYDANPRFTELNYLRVWVSNICGVQ